MDKLDLEMRLQWKGDSQWFPLDHGIVYVRNQVKSLRLHGEKIEEWVGQITRILDGKSSLEELAGKLHGGHRARFLEIVQVLYEQNLIRDVCTDKSHQLPDNTLEQYAGEIDYLNNQVGSGAYRFQCYQNLRILLIGSSKLSNYIRAALEQSGISQIVTYESVKEITETFSWMIYFGEEELEKAWKIAQEKNAHFLPIIFLPHAGFVGPINHTVNYKHIPDDLQIAGFTPIAGKLLANVASFALFQHATGVNTNENRYYVLSFDTMVGKWYVGGKDD